MKKVLFKIALLTVLLLTLSVSSATAALYSKEFAVTDGTSIAEAENMAASSAVTRITSAEASGGTAVKITASGTNTGADNLLNPTLSADFVLKEAGVYSFWMRVIAPSTASNELFYTYTGIKNYNTVSFPVSTSYAWVKVFQAQALNGAFTVSLKYKESGITIDKIILTSVSEFVPSQLDSVPDGEVSRIYPLPPIKPISGHPRLFATADMVDKLYQNAQSDELKKMYNEMVSASKEEPLYCALSDNIVSGTNCPQALTATLQARAYLSLVGQATNEENRKTIDYMKQLFASVKWDPTYQDITRRMGDIIVTGAVIYDWCYDEMTSADKEFFIAYFKKTAMTKEVSYPPVMKYAFAGHGGEREIMFDLLSAGIACYDEDTEIYDLAAGRYFAEYVETRRIFNNSGSHPVGSSYGHFRLSWELASAVIFDRMGYKNVLGEGITTVPYRYVYQRLPFGLWVKDNDDYTYGAYKYFLYNTNDALCYLLASCLSGDGYLKGEWLKAFSLSDYSYQSQNFCLWALLFSNPDIEVASLEKLPLTYKSTYPLTALTARTSWQMGLDAHTSVIHMKAEEKVTADTAFADLGNFMIYYKGNLALNGGSYGGSYGNWGSSHAINYAKRTISKNCMTVFDPYEEFTDFYGTQRVLSNDGGQRVFAPRIRNYRDYIAAGEQARCDGLYIGPNKKTPVFSYVKTDLTNAYSSKITQYSRAMVAINLFDEVYPQGFICFDNIKTKRGDLKKTWNLQAENEPLTSGRKTVITRTDNGFNGKLVNTTLLPSEISLTKVGGAGYDSWVNGVNYPNPDIGGCNTDQGGWRVELSPKLAAKEDLFLNAMYVTDADNEAELTTIYEENGDFCGATMKNATVYFKKSYNMKQSSAFTLTVRNNGYNACSLLITDVAEGKWKVSNSTVSYVVEVMEKENVICISCAPGTYSFTPVASSEAAEQMTFEEVSRNKIGDFHIYNTNTKLFMYQEKPTKIINGVVYVPVRGTFEPLGATVGWDGTRVTVSKNSTAVITPGTKNYSNNGAYGVLNYAPLNIDGTVYVNPDDFRNVLGCNFTFDSVAEILKIW